MTKTNQPPLQSVGNASRKSEKIVLRETSKGSATPKQANTPRNSCIRERGVIEKLLNKYGFIKSSERDARFFFHFSQYNSDIATMRVGDIVEFEESNDQRSGRPLAICVVRLDLSEQASTEPNMEQTSTESVLVSSNRISGTVVKEAKDSESGSVSYVNSGEYFFLPFSKSNIENDANLKAGESITFLLGTTANGVACACNVRPTVSQSERYQGVISSMKDSFGFIERSDVVREIFFHFSEYEPNDGDSNLQLGDDVEFSIQSRSGKEVAVQLTKLKRGTVIFEDIGIEVRRGKIQRLLKSTLGKFSSDPLGGRIVYETVTGPIEIPFGDRDQKCEHTFLVGDLVEFNIASDRRDKLQRATNIVLLEDTFAVNGENREKGEIVTLKEGYGFIRCWDRDARIFFHFSECLDVDRYPQLHDVIEFTVTMDPNTPSKPLAIRIKYLAEGEYIRPQANTNGVNATSNSRGKFQNTENDENVNETVPSRSPYSGNRASTSVQQGFIATLKDKFGFIELADHQKEVFFHFSNFQGNTSDLKLGDEVEFTLSKKTARVSADNVKKLPKGTIETEEVQPEFYTGKVLQGLRVNNPDQDSYAGIIVKGLEEDANATQYQFGITSLVDPKDPIQPGDNVVFQLAVNKASDHTFATNITILRKRIISRVDTVKGEYGFLAYEVEEGRKLYFRMSDVLGEETLHPGDDVEFVIVTQRDGKHSAKQLQKLASSTDSPRPDRLISKLKSMDVDGLLKVTVLRPPKGPDGTKGFTYSRKGTLSNASLLPVVP